MIIHVKGHTKEAKAEGVKLRREALAGDGGDAVEDEAVRAYVTNESQRARYCVRVMEGYVHVG